jgi:hypothetical protein
MPVSTLVALCDKFPDFFEVHQENEDSPPTIVFICVRKNNRAFQTDQEAALRWLEQAGFAVKVRIGSVDMTLDQFAQNGVVGTNQAIRPLAQSTYYAKRQELRRLERGLETLPADDVQRPLIVSRVSQLKRSLGVADDAMTSQEDIKLSDDRLNVLSNAAFLQLYSDSDLLRMTYEDVNSITPIAFRTLAMSRRGWLAHPENPIYKAVAEKYGWRREDTNAKQSVAEGGDKPSSGDTTNPTSAPTTQGVD